MGNQELKNKVTRTFYKMGLKFKQHSPEILIATGIIGGITTVVLACKATRNIQPIIDNHKTKIEEIHGSENECSKKEYQKNLTVTYAKTGLELVKLYAPAITTGALATASVLAANNIMSNRNAALVAAYTTVDNGFKFYRKNVVERFGEELDRELKLGIKSKEVEETVIDENGKEKKVTKTVAVVSDDARNHSIYARCFDDGNTGWTKNPEHNMWVLRQHQNWANQRLQTVGFLFLNEVYEALGYPRTAAGQIIGWVYDPSNPNLNNYVDFGIYNVDNRDFVNTRENVVWLDFNVDGDVMSLLK